MLSCSRFLKGRSQEGIPFRFAWSSWPSFWLSPRFPGTPSLRGLPDQSLWKALSGNNDLVLEPFMGGPPLGQSLWKAFACNNNLVLEPFPGGTLWLEPRTGIS